MQPQDLVNALLIGGLYAIAATGFSLVWGVLGVVNIAHGSFIMLGAYVAYWLSSTFGLDPLLAVPIAAGALFVFGYLVHLGITSRAASEGFLMTLIITFGLDLLIVNSAVLLWSADYRTVQGRLSGVSLGVGALLIPSARLVILLLALVLASLVQLFLTRTHVGNAIRAAAMNRRSAELVGVNITVIHAVTFGLGAALAGAAGAMVSTIFSIYPSMGYSFIMRAFAVTVLGGLGSVSGAFVGGLVLGLAEVTGARLFGPGYQDATAFALLVLFLVIRPRGLFGTAFSAA